MCNDSRRWCPVKHFKNFKVNLRYGILMNDGSVEVQWLLTQDTFQGAIATPLHQTALGNRVTMTSRLLD